MRLWLRTLLGLMLLAGALIGAWCYAHREQLARQWACYRVAAAESFQQAQAEITWFEHGPNRHNRLAELAREWGTGDPQFDLHLARHLRDAASSELLRETFSKELGRRKELLPRWAHYWSYQAPLEPDQQIASIIEYFDTLVAAERFQQITWREVLDLQAVFHLIGQSERARKLSSTNWHEHYRPWRETRSDKFPHVARPGKPFAD